MSNPANSIAAVCGVQTCANLVGDNEGFRIIIAAQGFPCWVAISLETIGRPATLPATE